MLKVTNLKKYFGGVKAVNRCSFEIKKNTITALIGPNGAGKSTVFNLITGLLKVDDGNIYLEDKDITNLPPEKISQLGISRMFQQSRIFDNLTVKDNLILSLDNEDTKFWKNFFSINREEEKIKRVKELLSWVGMSNYMNKLARDLSYGQKRLIELCRTILNPHKLLILDEPVAGINPKLRNLIKKLLLELKKKGDTILIIEHDTEFTLSISDWVLVMDEGRIISEGKPSKIRRDPKVLEAYLGE